MLRKTGVLLAIVLVLAGCSSNTFVWSLENGRWLAQYENELYSLAADIPSISPMIDADNRARAEAMARVFAAEVEERNAQQQENIGKGIWVLQGESSAIQKFATSVALIEYAYLPRDAHGSYRIETKTYGAEGEVLNLKSLFLPECDVYRELSRLSRWMLMHTGQLGDYTDEKWIDAGTEPTADNFSAFLVRPEGLELIFVPYQIGPWVLGEQRITIPWLHLKGYLTPETEKAVGVAENEGEDMDFAV